MTTTATIPGQLAQNVLARRDKQLEDNAARKIFNAVKSWRLKPGEVSERWMWELLQNASDTAIANKRHLTARFQLTDQELVFEHTGGPFTYDDITALIYGGSAKSFDGIVFTGHFGSGFLVTHAISATILVSGTSEIREPFLLNFQRTGTVDEIRENVSSCIQQLYVHPEIETMSSVFRYQQLGAEGQQIAQTGFGRLDQALPYVFAFTPHLDRVTLVADTEIEWRRGEASSSGPEGIVVVPVQRLENGMTRYFEVYVKNSESGESALLITLENTTRRIVALGPAEPRIYHRFPLLSSNAVGLPFVLNGRFDVDEDRSIAFLTKSAAIQPSSAQGEDVGKICSLVRDAVSLLQYAGALSIEDLHFALGVCVPASQLGEPGPWRQALAHLAGQLSQTRVVRVAIPLETVLEPVRCTFISASLIKTRDSVELTALWRLVSRYKLSMPASTIMPVWERIIQGWKELGINGLTIWTVESVLQKIRGRKKLEFLAEDLGTSVEGAVQWLGDALDLLTPIRDTLPNDFFSGVLPNQYGEFKSPPELKRDENVDEVIKNISDELGSPTLRSELLDSRLTAGGQGRDALLQLYVHDSLNTTAAFRKLVQQVRSRVPIPQTRKPGWKLEDSLGKIVVRLALWAAGEDSEHDVTVRELPWITSDGEPRYVGTEPLAMAPVQLWEQSAQSFADIYPESKRLSSAYSDLAGDFKPQLTTALVRWGICPSAAVTSSIQARMNRELVRLLIDGAPDAGLQASYVCDQVSDIAFLTEILRRVRESKARTVIFLSFLLQYVASKDDRWRSRATARAANGSSVTIRPSEWLARIKKDQWVPVLNDESGEVEGIHPSAGTLAEFVAWGELDGSPHASQLLRFLGFDVLELAIKIASKGSGQVEQTLKSELAQVVSSTDVSGLQMLVEQLQKRRAGLERFAKNREFGLRIQGLVQRLLEERGKKVIVDDRGYDFRVYEHGDVDPDSDIGTFSVGPYLVEVKSARTDEVGLSRTQAITSVSNKETYVLLVVDLRSCVSAEPDEDEVFSTIRIVSDIGIRIEPLLAMVEGVCTGSDGIRIDTGEQLRYCVGQSVWNTGIGLDEWINAAF
jgi:hypothetical protein